MVFAQLTGAYWLDDAGEDCWRRLARQDGQRPASSGEGLDPVGRLNWLRAVMLPVAVVTVTAALVVGTLA